MTDEGLQCRVGDGEFTTASRAVHAEGEVGCCRGAATRDGGGPPLLVIHYDTPDGAARDGTAPAAWAASMAARFAVTAPLPRMAADTTRTFFGILEGVLQRGRVGEVSGADPYTACGETCGPGHVAHADAHGLGGNPLE